MQMSRSSAFKSGSLAVLAATLFGAGSQYLGTLDNPAVRLFGSQSSDFFLQISNQMSALWLVVPFLAGATQSTKFRGAVVATAAAFAEMLAYCAMILSPTEGMHLGPAPVGLHGTWNQLNLGKVEATLSSQWIWFLGAALAGPIFGIVGALWRRGTQWLVILPLGAVVLEPVVRWLAHNNTLASQYSLRWPTSSAGVAAEFTELGLGLALLVWQSHRSLSSR